MTDKEKLAELYRLYEKQLYAIALAVLHNHAQAEDAVSDAYYRVVRHIGMLGKPDSPQTRQYMIRTIRSTAISQYRKNQRESAHCLPIDETQTDIPDRSDILTRRIERHSLLETIASLLGILNETDRQIVVWYGRDGIGFDRIAARLGMTEAAARKRFERARKRMKAHYTEGEERYETYHK